MSLFGRGNSPSVPPRQTPPPPVPARPKDDDAPARPRAHASRGGVARLSMEVSSCPSQDLALSNMVFLHPDDFASLSPNGEKVYVMLNGFVYTAAGNSGVGTGKVALNGVQRRITRTSGGDAVTLETFTPDSMITSVTYEVDLNLKVKGQAETVEHDEFAGKIRDRFKNQVMSMGQEIVMEFLGKNFLIKVVDMEAQATVKSGHKSHALLTVETEVMCRKVPEGGAVKIQGGESHRPNVGIIAPDWNFEKMGIGGLDKEFTDIFRRAFASRVFPPSVIKKLGLNHVKGMLLYGPPGTGKTLIARQIGKMLNGREPKVVNGPEILNKYVGASEENIRNLFKDAIADQKANGEDSALHIIIFDEIDAICKQRGSGRDGTGVHDTVVNQLLSMIDGVDSLNNILVIGMTNRKDMIDEAMIRPGRLEIQIEIALPDKDGRRQIFNIHTRHMRENGKLARDVDLDSLAVQTKNYTGAEIESVVKGAASFMLQRKLGLANIRETNLTDTLKSLKDLDDVQVTMADFERALQEVRPAYGVQEDEIKDRIGDIISYGEKYEHLWNSIKIFIEQLRQSERQRSLSILLEGAVGTGKTSLAAKAAIESAFPFVKFVSPEALVGYSEGGKCSVVTKVFDDSSKSPLSVIVLDSIERILDYTAIGMRFSNAVLQALLVLIKRQPPKGKKLLIIGTTAVASVLETMELCAAFNITLHVPSLGPEECRAVVEQMGVMEKGDLNKSVNALAGVDIGIKKLLLVLEMARTEGSSISHQRFVECMRDCGL